jgi:hypothetical protein
MLLAALFGLIAVASCKSSKHAYKKLPGYWQPQPVTIDGSNKDWPSPYPDYDDKAQIGYAISNDRDNLYITVETGDPATQLKIIKEGLTVWIDRKGEKNELTAINFPIPSAGQTGERAAGGPAQPGAGQQRQRMELEDRVKKALEGANEYSLQGFKFCNLQFPILENDSCGIKVRMAIDEDNELVWEAVVPFKSFYFKNEISRPDRGRPLSVCFETTAMKRPPGQPAAHNGGGSGGGMRPSFGVGGMGGMGMGMGMHSGGMRGGNRSQPANTDMMEAAYKSTKTWKQFGLAYEEAK